MRMILLLLLLPSVAFAQESHYVTVFGSGSNPLRFKHTHTFATFTKVTESPSGQVIENHTISWMPATLNIRPFALRPEPGVNLTQDQSFQWAESHGLRTSVWGPYNITPERYEALLVRETNLESGRFRYRAIGGFTKSSTVSNCGQSFTRAVVVGQRYLQPTPLPGEQGTSLLVERGFNTAPHPVSEHPELLPSILAPGHEAVPREPGERIRRFGR
jgi:hypothetical protein